jgi:hypothetical protein
MSSRLKIQSKKKKTLKIALKKSCVVPHHILTLHSVIHACTLLSSGNCVCLIDCFEPREQFFSYLAAVIFTGYRAANLDLSLALTCVRLLAVRVLLRATLTAIRNSVFKFISERPVILTSECCALGEVAIKHFIV